MTKLGDREIPSQPARFGDGRVETAPERDDKVVTGVTFRGVLSEPTGTINCWVNLEGEHGLVFAFCYVRMTMTFGDELVGQTFGAIRRQFRERDIALVARTTVPSYSFTLTRTGMPTQAEGRIAGDRPYYFHARHGRWRLYVGDPGWPTEFCDWPRRGLGIVAASGGDDTNGHMTEAQVRAILDRVLAGPNHA